MFTKTGLRVREINTGRSSFSQGIGQGQGKKLSPLGAPTPTRTRATTYRPSLPVQSGKSVADSETPGASAGTRADHDRALKLRNESAASATAAIYGRDPSRSVAGKDVKNLSKKAGRPGAGDGTRRVPRRKPAWDDSLRDHSEFKLTPEEAAQRKKALVSKHNTLVFGARSTSALAAQDKEAAAAAASAAAAARVAARSAPTQESEHPRRVASRGRSDSANRNRSGNGSSRRSSSRGKARPLPQSGEQGGQPGSGGTAADEPSPTLVSGAATDTTVMIVPNTKTPEGSKGAGAMETPRGNVEGMLDLSEIELGIRDFSQRVLRLEAGEGEGFGIEVGDPEESASGISTTVHEILDESTERKSSSDEAGGHNSRGIAGGVTSLRGRTSCSPREASASAMKEPMLSDGVTGRPRGPDSPQKKESILEDEDIVERIHRLEERVRELQLYDALHDADGTSNVECVGTIGKQSEVLPGRSEGVRSVLEGLLSLSARLLKRAIAAERRLREHALDGDGDDAMVAPISEQDEEETAVLSARGTAILAGMKAGEAAGRRAGDAATVEPAASISVDEDVVTFPLKAASGLPEERQRCNDSSPLPSTWCISEVEEPEPEQDIGLETPTTGPRIHPGSMAADESPVRRVRERTSSRDLRRVPPTPVSKDCWSEALDAVSTLVSKGPGVPGLVQASRGSLASTSPPAPSNGVSQAEERVQASCSHGVEDSEKTDDVPETALSFASVRGSVSPPLRQCHEEEQRSGEGNGTANTSMLSRRALAPMCTVGATPRVLGSERGALNGEGKAIGGADDDRESLDGEGDGARLASNLLAPTPMEKPEHPFEGRLPSRSSSWLRRQGLMDAGVESVARCSVSSDDKFERCSASRRTEGGTIYDDGAPVEPIRGGQKLDGAGGDRGDFKSSAAPLIGEWYTPS